MPSNYQAIYKACIDNNIQEIGWLMSRKDTKIIYEAAGFIGDRATSGMIDFMVTTLRGHTDSKSKVRKIFHKAYCNAIPKATIGHRYFVPIIEGQDMTLHDLKPSPSSLPPEDLRSLTYERRAARLQEAPNQTTITPAFQSLGWEEQLEVVERMREQGVELTKGK